MNDEAARRVRDKRADQAAGVQTDPSARWRSRVLVATAALAALALLAGCGGGAAKTRTIDLVTNDSFRFSPAEIRVKAGERITVQLRNPGVLAHDFVTRGQATDAKIEVAAGQTASGAFSVAAKPGRYEFICAQPGHEQAGMKGTIIVE
ncbi:MAG: cupredoxin domain-containing protein [Chloroflexi bacterium]|nr:cupredoxin domain-containing protein [Chloroflexota bacterium]